MKYNFMLTKFNCIKYKWLNIFLIFIGILFFIFSISNIGIAISLSKNNLWAQTYSNTLYKYFPLNTLFSSYLPHSLLSATNFCIGYIGFGNFISHSNNALWNFYTINTFILLPILGATTLFYITVVISAIFCRKVHKMQVLSFYKKSRIIFMFSISFFFFFLILGTMLVEIFENTSSSNTLFKFCYGTDLSGKTALFTNGSEKFSTVMDILKLYGSLIQYYGFGYIMQHGIVFTGSENIILPLYTKVGIVFIYIIMPIFLLLISLSFSTRTYSSWRLQNVSVATDIKWQKTKTWLQYSNISSKKELKERYFFNTGLIIMMISFLFVVTTIFIFLGIIWKSHSDLAILLLILGLLGFAIAFIPTYIMIFSIKRLKNIKYNLFLLFQFFSFLIMGLILEVIISISISTSVYFPDFLLFSFLLIYFLISSIAFNFFKIRRI